MKFTPRPYQRIIGDFIADHPRCNVFAGMGMGKTTSTIAAFDTLRLFGEAKRLLVIAPKRVARGTWPAEIQKWRESFGHLKIAAAIGTQEQRIAALKSGADIVTINYDNLEWLVEIVGEHWPWDMVASDESTRLKGLRISLQTSKAGKDFTKGQGATRAKALSQVAFRKVRRWVNLTGSPAPNGVVDLWGQMWFVDGGQRLGTSFTAFENRWFRSRPNADGYRQIEPLPFAQAQIQAAIRDVCITVDPRDWFDIKDPIESVIKVPLPPKARRAYEQMEREFFAEVDNNPVTALNSGGKWGKCLQIGNGRVIYDTENKLVAEVHDEKLEALKSVVSEANGESILVSYQYKADYDAIRKAFPRAKGLDDGPNIEAEWNAGRIPMLVVHPQSAGHGLNLQDGGRILCDYSTGINLEYDEQVIERVGPMRQIQSGHDRAVYRYRLVAEDTVEEHVNIPRIRTKASVQELVKDAMKRRDWRNATASH